MALSLRQKIGSGFWGITVLVIICGSISLFQLSRLSHSIEQAMGGTGQKLEITGDLVQETNLLRHHGARFLVVGSPDDRTAALAHLAALQQRLELAIRILPTQADRSGLSEIRQLLTHYGRQFQAATERFEDRAVVQMEMLKEIEYIESPLRQFFIRHPERQEVRSPFLFFNTAQLKINTYLHSLNSQDFYEATRSLELVEKLVQDGSERAENSQAAEWKDVATRVRKLRTTLTAFYYEAYDLQNTIKNTLLPLPGEVLQRVQEVAKENWQELQDASSALSAMMEQVWLVVLIAVITVFSVSALVPFVVTRSSTRPLIQMGAVLHDMAEGEGDLTQRLAVDTQDEIGQLAHWFNSFMDKLHTIIDEVRQTSYQLTTAAQQLAATTQHLSRGAQEQASSLEEAAASLEQLTSTVRQNADNAQRANEFGLQSRDAAKAGGEVVTTAVAAMDNINAASKQIADIVSVIDEIAFQTNLLALNAAVEAARAGEQGRGFSVVAAEVRNLAQRSATAAKEIRNLIHDSVQKVSNGSALVQQSGKALGDIVQSVQQVTTLIEGIAGSSQEQSAGIEQVNDMVGKMDHVVQGNVTQTDELASTAQSLGVQAEQLQSLVQRFKLKTPDSSLPRLPEKAASSLLARDTTQRDDASAQHGELSGSPVDKALEHSFQEF